MAIDDLIEKIRADKTLNGVTLTKREAIELIEHLIALATDGADYAGTTYDEYEVEHGLSEIPAFVTETERLMEALGIRRKFLIR